MSVGSGNLVILFMSEITEKIYIFNENTCN